MKEAMCGDSPKQGGGIWVLSELGRSFLFPGSGRSSLKAGKDPDDLEIMQSTCGQVCARSCVAALCRAEGPLPLRLGPQERSKPPPVPGHHFIPGATSLRSGRNWLSGLSVPALPPSPAPHCIFL